MFAAFLIFAFDVPKFADVVDFKLPPRFRLVATEFTIATPIVKTTKEQS